MNRSIALLFALLSVSPAAWACSCPAETESLWNGAHQVALVRIDAVHVERELAMSRKRCTASEATCTMRQVASYTPVEFFKGNRLSAPTLATGYGGGDCGLPMIAGTYYLIFASDTSGQIGICNAAGPYRWVGSRNSLEQPKVLKPLLEALRKRSKEPATKLPPRPPSSLPW
ncbi:hypothetical protein [Lysobacter sp. ESA13C]|uniref:hypothetical protein n=1 Tax=Lysobacter sp. ESA13C TaxID=2862676 RepID=UPI001CBCBD85|nr:hypothetical protein [Lysobacter sp. ESA13C]